MLINWVRWDELTGLPACRIICHSYWHTARSSIFQTARNLTSLQTLVYQKYSQVKMLDFGNALVDVFRFKSALDVSICTEIGDFCLAPWLLQSTIHCLRPICLCLSIFSILDGTGMRWAKNCNFLPIHSLPAHLVPLFFELIPIYLLKPTWTIVAVATILISEWKLSSLCAVTSSKTPVLVLMSV